MSTMMIVIYRLLTGVTGNVTCCRLLTGVGGNLVAVQASRLSTALHRVSSPGHLPDNMSVGCTNPWSAFCGNSR